MIKQLMPLTRNKMEILAAIYEDGETHLLDISRQLKLHPYSVQKTMARLKPFLKSRKAGRTNLVSIDKASPSYQELARLIEDYRLHTKSSMVNSVIMHLTNLFSEDNVLACCLFGSYARMSFSEESDIDVLLVVKRKGPALRRKISQLSSVLGKEVSPLILSQSEFEKALKSREPTIMSLAQPRQRLVVRGAGYFLGAMER
ncbi:MAG: nucleotidyltransferase domain-containing protein [Candidatus Aenigmarchaeota archaeon]|nr:nucleotidyltransferase domain-containing protein [Candidatus Aenigmarchaeota archaeon]